MPPKKPSKQKVSKSSSKKTEEQAEEDRQNQEKQTETGEGRVSTGSKRKAPPTSSLTASARKATKKSPSPSTATITFLLSEAALSLCHNPKASPASPAAQSSGTSKDYFSPDLTPFEHLLCAVILSRPISHVLGQRTIKTVLSEPWDWHDAESVKEAGREDEDGKTERVHAMESAKTQHRQKTAAELGGLAEVVLKEGWDQGRDGGLKGLLDEVNGQEMAKEIRVVLKEKVKGLGDTGVDIFLRRVQGIKGWEGIGWFVDKKTAEALKEVGLPGDGEGVKKCVEESGSEDVRRDFVVVLERALGIVLEKKQGEMKKPVKGRQ